MDFPESTLKRLPRYFRCLRTLLINGELRISSASLAKELNVTASQVRSDLNYIGNCGQQGYGYSVKTLYTQISKALGAGDGLKAVVIGEAYSPIFNKTVFEGRGITLIGVFCNQIVNELTLYDHEITFGGVEEAVPFCEKEKPDLAVFLPMKQDPRTLAICLKECGTSGIVNLSQQELFSDVMTIRNVSIGDLLMTVTCQMHNREE